MEMIENIIEHLQRWFARYKRELASAEAKDRRRLTIEIQWNGAMIGDLRRRSLDA
jgi:hypothetical protein